MRQNTSRGLPLLAALWLLTIGALALIFAATLFPFNFEFRPIGIGEYFHSFRYFPSSFRDLPENILLFAPFGYCLAGLLARPANATSATILFRVGYLGFGLTLLVETLQIFLPSRTSNVSDLLANTIGAVLGAAIFQLLRLRLPWKQQFAKGLSVPFGTILLLFFFAVGSILLAFLAWGMHPSNWDVTYKLALGNEMTGDRPWRGSVSNLKFLDTALTASEAAQILKGTVSDGLSPNICASYLLAGSAPYLDLTGKSTPLAFVSNQATTNSQAPQLGPSRWLLSKAPLAAFSSRVNQTREFTIALTLASFDPSQSGPARVVTISENTTRRNLTLGQEGNALVLRWRSPFQGSNGASAQVCFPGVFKSNERQHLVIVFSSTHLTLFRLNSGPVSLSITPALGFSALLHEDQTHSVFAGDSRLRLLDFILSALALAPSGAILGTLRFRASSKKMWLLLPAFVLATLQETLVASLGETEMFWSQVAVTAIVFFILTGLTLHLRRILESPGPAA